MQITDEDLELFAARIRPYFEPGLRDIAQELALGIARLCGAKVKLLRPETRLGEIFEWINSTESFPNSLDQIEWVMALETDLGLKIDDDQASQPDLTTFRDLVLRRAGQRHAA